MSKLNITRLHGPYTPSRKYENRYGDIVIYIGENPLAKDETDRHIWGHADGPYSTSAEGVYYDRLSTHKYDIMREHCPKITGTKTLYVFFFATSNAERTNPLSRSYSLRSDAEDGRRSHINRGWTVSEIQEITLPFEFKLLPSDLDPTV